MKTRENGALKWLFVVAVPTRTTEFVLGPVETNWTNEACSETWMALSEKKRIRKLEFWSASSMHKANSPSRMFHFSDDEMCDTVWLMFGVRVWLDNVIYLFICPCLRSYYLFLSSLYSRECSRDTPPDRQCHYGHYYMKRITSSNINATARTNEISIAYYFFSSSARKPHIYCSNEPLSEHNGTSIWGIKQ